MIRVRGPAEPPAILLSEGRRKTAEDCAAHEAGVRDFEFDKSVYGHPSVKDTLVECHHGKCCYCESQVRHVSPGNIDHYRPMAASQQAIGEPFIRPGYYWLAYEWTNLLFVCHNCNQYFKRNLFPLENPSRRALSHRDRIEDEQPLLLNPCLEDPADFVQFREEFIIAVEAHPRGNATIWILKLNERPDLVERRREHLNRMKMLRTIPRLLPGSPEASEAEACLRKALEETGEYSAMIRCGVAPI
jgi:hypothetical protein